MVALAVVAAFAWPHLRSGSRVLTPKGERVVGRFGGRLGPLGRALWRPLRLVVHPAARTVARPARAARRHLEPVLEPVIRAVEEGSTARPPGGYHEGPPAPRYVTAPVATILRGPGGSAVPSSGGPAPSVTPRHAVAGSPAAAAQAAAVAQAAAAGPAAVAPAGAAAPSPAHQAPEGEDDEGADDATLAYVIQPFRTRRSSDPSSLSRR